MLVVDFAGWLPVNRGAHELQSEDPLLPPTPVVSRLVVTVLKGFIGGLLPAETLGMTWAMASEASSKPDIISPLLYDLHVSMVLLFNPFIFRVVLRKW